MLKAIFKNWTLGHRDDSNPKNYDVSLEVESNKSGLTIIIRNESGQRAKIALNVEQMETFKKYFDSCYRYTKNQNKA